MKIRKAVIPVAGKGTRMLPVTKSIPKEMIPLYNKPLIQYVVEEALAAGIEEIIFITSNGKEDILKYFSRNTELEVFLDKNGKSDELKLVQNIGNMANIITVNQKDQLGLGHAILQAAPILGNEPFAVLLPDDLIVSQKSATGQLQQISEANANCSVIGMIEVPRDQTYKYGIIKGNFLPNDKRTLQIEDMIEKPKPELAPSFFAAPGRYIFDAKILDCLREIKRGAGGEYQLTDAIALLAKSEKVLGSLIEGDRFDVGSMSGYLEAMMILGVKDPEVRGELIRVMDLARSLIESSST